MNNLFFPPLTTNLNLSNVNHRRVTRPSSISIMFLLCLVPLTQKRMRGQQTRMRMQMEIKYSWRQLCPTVTRTRSLNRSSWKVSSTLICSRAATTRRALPRKLLRFSTCGTAVAGMLWPGMLRHGIDSSSDSDDDTLSYNWASGRGRCCGRAAPSVAGTANLAGLRPRTRQNLWVIPAWGRSLVVNVQNLKKILLKLFMTRLLENCF